MLLSNRIDEQHQRIHDVRALVLSALKIVDEGERDEDAVAWSTLRIASDICSEIANKRKRAGVAHGGGFARGRRCPRHNEHTTSVYRRSRWTGQRGEMRLCRYGSL